ncbi:hypothetical protein E4K72_09980 [Oxalobacteraceae bacterium OM1]|nr:hypothetical protein E4K72_09980 [Oxalobacteraceae bacterium OM1]
MKKTRPPLAWFRRRLYARTNENAVRRAYAGPRKGSDGEFASRADDPGASRAAVDLKVFPPKGGGRGNYFGARGSQFHMASAMPACRYNMLAIRQRQASACPGAPTKIVDRPAGIRPRRAGSTKTFSSIRGGLAVSQTPRQCLFHTDALQQAGPLQRGGRGMASVYTYRLFFT